MLRVQMSVFFWNFSCSVSQLRKERRSAEFSEEDLSRVSRRLTL